MSFVMPSLLNGAEVKFTILQCWTMIDQKVSEFRSWIPGLIGYVHGQMSEIQLENTYWTLLKVSMIFLVTTTIIETGVDIPNANTLFIE